MLAEVEIFVLDDFSFSTIDFDGGLPMSFAYR
jgi:hypothetical protein